MDSAPVSILLVCLGNICRSPTAEGVLRARAEARGLGKALVIDSAGTSDWHVGAAPDKRSIAHARERGYELGSLRARQVKREDFERFDLILAMDEANRRDLLAMSPAGQEHKLSLFLSCLPRETVEHSGEVPDPYHLGAAGFERVLDLIEAASDSLLDALSKEKT